MFKILASLWAQKLPRTLLLSRPMHTCVMRLRWALSPEPLQNGTGEQLQKNREGPASPGDIVVKAVGWTEGKTGYSRA